MRAYLAVLKDSFREALASRVLWILLIIITVVLVLLAPVGFRESLATRLQRSSVRNWPGLMTKIQTQAAREESSPARQIAGRFSAALKQQLADATEQSAGELSGELIDAIVEELNAVIEGPPLYDATIWQDVKLGKEAGDLQERAGSLKPEEKARFNRLLLEAAWPPEFARDDGETRLTYLGFESNPLPLPHKQLIQAVGITLVVIINWAVGVFGVFAAILVTSSIIPQMFEAGAIDLLLSKPTARVLLFLTKFFGGCAFIGLIAAYFITGLYLIAGARFGIWNSSMFLCIPIMLFLFSIYYGISALAGVIWRNAIISVVITVLFWCLCFSIGVLKGFIEPLWIDLPRLVKVVPTGNGFLGVNETGGVWEWQSRDSRWTEVFLSDDAGRANRTFMVPQTFIGPIYDSKRERIIAAAPNTPPPGIGGGGFNLFAQAPPLLIGNRAGAWTRKKSGTAPLGTVALFSTPAGNVLAVTKGAVFRLSEKSKGQTVQEEFVRIGPDQPLSLDPTASVAMSADTGTIVAFNRGTVVLLEPDADGKYARRQEKEIVPAKESKSAVVALAGATLVVVLSDGRVLVVDTTDLSIKHEYRPVGDQSPRFAVASPGGHWVSVLFHNRQLWMFDVRQSRPAALSIAGQGDISAVAFDGPDRMVAIDRGTRITNYDLEPFQLRDRVAPPLDSVQTAYYYAIQPVYTVLPKPGELGNVVAYLLTDLNELQELGGPRDLSQIRQKVDLAGPIWSSLAFLAGVLAVASCYVWRKDF